MRLPKHFGLNAVADEEVAVTYDELNYGPCVISDARRRMWGGVSIKGAAPAAKMSPVDELATDWAEGRGNARLVVLDR